MGSRISRRYTGNYQVANEISTTTRVQNFYFSTIARVRRRSYKLSRNLRSKGRKHSSSPLLTRVSHLLTSEDKDTDVYKAEVISDSSNLMTISPQYFDFLTSNSTNSNFSHLRIERKPPRPISPKFSKPDSELHRKSSITTSKEERQTLTSVTTLSGSRCNASPRCRISSKVTGSRNSMNDDSHGDSIGKKEAILSSPEISSLKSSINVSSSANNLSKKMKEMRKSDISMDRGDDDSDDITNPSQFFSEDTGKNKNDDHSEALSDLLQDNTIEIIGRDQLICPSNDYESLDSKSISVTSSCFSLYSESSFTWWRSMSSRTYRYPRKHEYHACSCSSIDSSDIWRSRVNNESLHMSDSSGDKSTSSQKKRRSGTKSSIRKKETVKATFHRAHTSSDSLSELPFF